MNPRYNFHSVGLEEMSLLSLLTTEDRAKRLEQAIPCQSLLASPLKVLFIFFPTEFIKEIFVSLYYF